MFDEGAPRDRVTIINRSPTDSPDIAEASFDLSSSAGQIIFDTREGGDGVEVFQDFRVEGGDATLAETPAAVDGADALALRFDRFAPGDELTFSIDVDDQLVDSELGQIQVTGAEIAGAVGIFTLVDGTTVTGVFGDDATLNASATC